MNYGTYRSNYKTYEEAINELNCRRSSNTQDLDKISNYSPFVLNGRNKCLVSYNEAGDIISCLCTKCLNKIDRSPVYNSQYVAPLCRECLIDISHIENTEKKEKNMKTTSKKNDVSKINIDWVSFESMMANGSAKLVALSTQYNVYPANLKEAIIAKYGKEISFKKGRNGGIIWTVKAVGQTNV